MKNIISIVLAVLLAAAMTIPAGAETPVSNTVDGIVDAVVEDGPQQEGGAGEGNVSGETLENAGSSGAKKTLTFSIVLMCFGIAVILFGDRKSGHRKQNKAEARRLKSGTKKQVRE